VFKGLIGRNLQKRRMQCF